MKKLPPLTIKQQEILHLLYTHRFLNRIQIQTLLNHKDKRRIIYWLKDMREKRYIIWIYDEHDFIQKSKPAIYYLSSSGVGFLKTLDAYPRTELRKRYAEPSRRPSFISKSLLLADCCINFEKRNRQKTGIEYSYRRDPIHTPNFIYQFLDDLRPDLYFVKKEQGGQQEDVAVTHYLLDVIVPTFPRYRLRKRLKGYATYLSDELWQNGRDNELPIVLIVCPTTAELLYAKRLTKKIKQDVWNEDDVHIRFTTVEKLKQQGVTSGIWEEA